MLVERWLTSSFEDRESALISRRHGVPGFFIVGCPGFSSCCFTEIDVPIDLRWVSQGISGLLTQLKWLSMHIQSLLPSDVVSQKHELAVWKPYGLLWTTAQVTKNKDAGWEHLKGKVSVWVQSSKCYINKQITENKAFSESTEKHKSLILLIYYRNWDPTGSSLFVAQRHNQW